MSKIHITFDDLCAFFTSKLSDNILMVGMIENQVSDPEDIHQPIITICEQGQVKEKYQGFVEVHGKVFLEVYGVNAAPTGPSIQDKAQLVVGQVSFNKVPDVEDHLYKGETLTVKADLCRARLYFQHGELYAESPTHRFDFFEVGSSSPIGNLRLDNVPDKVALDIALPTDGYAVLRFENGTREFRFYDGKDYDVEITNKPATREKDSRHFLHFYEIVVNLPRPPIFPLPVPPPIGKLVGPFCVESIFSKADFD